MYFNTFYVIKICVLLLWLLVTYIWVYVDDVLYILCLDLGYVIFPGGRLSRRRYPTWSEYRFNHRLIHSTINMLHCLIIITNYSLMILHSSDFNRTRVSSSCFPTYSLSSSTSTICTSFRRRSWAALHCLCKWSCFCYIIQYHYITKNTALHLYIYQSHVTIAMK